ncbi:hypothetical protein JCGZ_15434 [Jatropha curcas]|uniref:Dynamin-type G domain-containing protein n=1 Tax=Jatropha curcas TaxID=180498 RepID=A0A067K8X2_JATCU|nr:hypothetical protein JCGZ_15434 [Jatropha curcas]
MGGTETPLSNGDEMEEYEEGSSLDLVNAEVEEDAVPIVSSYNDHVRPLLDAVDKLRLLKVTIKGIQQSTIVVVDDQPFGKSSILESLAGISNTQFTLVVKHNGVPNLIMIDLPGITWVPVHGQPDNIYEQIAGIIMEDISPKESIILNVLSATIGFPTCESIRISQQVDKTGERTLAVVSMSDKAPEGFLEKVTADDVNIGLAYIGVRNRIGDESYGEASKQEAVLFENHPLPSKIDKSIVAVTIFLGIVGSAKESLRKILVRGEYDEYSDDHDMHCTTRLVEMLNEYSNDLHHCPKSDPTRNFLMEEIHILEESRGIELPNFLPRTAFLSMLQKKVEWISEMLIDFIEKVWTYIENVVLSILMHHSENYNQLQLSIARAGCELISKMKDRSISWVMEIVQMEKVTNYTCNPEYMSEWNKLMGEYDTFKKQIRTNSQNAAWIEGIESIEFLGIKNYQDNVVQQAFDLKMRMTAYWKIVLGRLIDSTALHLQFSIQNLVNREMEK